MTKTKTNKSKEAYKCVLDALKDSAAAHSVYHQDASLRDTANALQSLANLYDKKALPPFGTLETEDRGGLVKTYAHIFVEHYGFEEFHDRLDDIVPVTVIDGVIHVDPLEPVDLDSGVAANRSSAINNIIALVARAVNEFNASGHTDVATYEGPSYFEAIEAHHHAYRYLDGACWAIENCEVYLGEIGDS